MKWEVVDIDPDGCEVIVGQGNFTIKTVEDLADALVSAAPGIEYGVAMNEAKPRVVRVIGNSEELKKRAGETALKIGAGHAFVIFMRKAFPIHVLPHIKALPTVVNVFVATSNPIQIIVAETDLGRAVVGAVDGLSVNHIEDEEERKEREELVRKFGYFPR